MCGIVGIVSKNNCISKILKGLKSLEYRGYDSSGLACIENNEFKYIKSVGKISNLSKKIKIKNFNSNISIGHTRWATHGKPSIKNTHPFIKKNCALVHNGIIENYEELIKKYSINKKKIKSQTDTEIAAEVFNKFLEKKISPIGGLIDLVKEIKGLYAFVFIIKGSDSIYAVRKGSPLVIGLSDNYNIICSDLLAMPDNVKKIIFLEENEIVKLDKSSFTIFDKKGKKIKRNFQSHSNKTEFISKNNFKHFMLKEIYYQPVSIEESLLNYLDKKSGLVHLPKCDIDFNKISNLYFASCGTAYYSTMIAKYWFEKFAKISTSVDIGSEYRYRGDVIKRNSIGLVVSQSGETMDTLECLNKFKKNNIYTMSIVNVITSTIARKSDYILPTLAGPEVGVASTKAFTSQLIVMALLSRYIQQQKNIYFKEVDIIFKSLFDVPKKLKNVLEQVSPINKIARYIKNAKSIFYIGRGTMYPLALEAALKLKEITYKHCEGYPAGELKHGPLALVEKNIPIIALAPFDENFFKILSNIQEIKAREGKVILITDKKGHKIASKYCSYSIIMPETNFLTSPIIYSLPVQLIAYRLGVLLNKNIDQPRNLAKSVTVE